MSEVDSGSKSKHFRKLPVLGSIIMGVLCFLYAIPLDWISIGFLGGISEIRFEILTINGQQYFLWGIMDTSSFILNFTQLNVETLLALLILICGLVSAICGLIGSSYKARPTKMKKLVKIAAFMTIMILLYHLTLYIFLGILGAQAVQFGTGFYLLVIAIVVYMIGFVKMTTYSEF